MLFHVEERQRLISLRAPVSFCDSNIEHSEFFCGEERGIRLFVSIVDPHLCLRSSEFAIIV